MPTHKKDIMQIASAGVAAGVSAMATIGAAAFMGDVQWIAVGSAAALAGILSLITSVAGIPEVPVPEQKE